MLAMFAPLDGPEGDPRSCLVQQFRCVARPTVQFRTACGICRSWAGTPVGRGICSSSIACNIPTCWLVLVASEFQGNFRLPSVTAGGAAAWNRWAGDPRFGPPALGTLG